MSLSSSDQALSQEREAPAPDTPFRDFLKRLLLNRSASMGAVILLVFLVAAILAPWITSHDPYHIDAAVALRSPSIEFPLGTDHFGRDILTRILYGSRISLTIGLIATGIAALVGMALGLMAGFYGGWVDDLIMRLMDVLLAFPGLVLALVMIVILGPSLFNVMVAVGFSRVPQFARMVRGQVLSVREMDYVSASKATGAGAPRVMARHIMPNILAPVMVLATVGVGTAILQAASLGYLGLGAQPPTPEWGLMLSETRQFLRFAWWTTAFPGIAIMISVIAINLFGDGIRDILDPRLRGR